MLTLAAYMLLSISSLLSVQNPPSITWDWYNAGEAYRNYKVKGLDDLAIAAHYYFLAAKNGNTSAAYKLGDAYENGTGVVKDYQQAMVWYRRAAERDDKYSEFRIGWFYQNGLGVGVDLPKAASWYELAAKHDNVWAYHMLAFMLADGTGVPKNVELAKQYFEYSLPTTNDPWAQAKLASLIKATDPNQSQMLIKKALASGNRDVAKSILQQ